MMTALGKFLVLLNTFVAVAVLAWAVSAYLTRVDPAEALDPLGQKLTDKVKKANDAAATAQPGYADELARVGTAEARLIDLKAKIAERLKQADDGVFYNIYADAAGRVGKLVWESPKERQILGLNGQPLAGVDQMTKNLRDEQSAAATHIAGIEAAAQQLTALNKAIDDLNARYAWLYEVGKRHEAELPVLADVRLNWESRSGLLVRRLNQLERRLRDLTQSGGAGASANTPPARTALTLPPTK